MSAWDGALVVRDSDGTHWTRLNDGTYTCVETPVLVDGPYTDGGDTAAFVEEYYGPCEVITPLTEKVRPQ